jgi:nicotinamidase/pyrazinamidase
MKFGKVLLTKDWHPPNHVSFFEHFSNKSVHPNAKLGEEYTFDLGDGRGMRSQILWPTHCVQNSTGAEIRVGLETKETDIIVYKGTHPDVDSYSGFVDNDGETETEMDAILKEHGIEELFVTGLAYEYCVGNTARDGLKKGYKVTIVDDATGSFSPDKKHEQADKFRKAGISIRTVTEILNSLSRTTTGLSCPSCACPTCTCSVILNSETKDIKPENSCHCSNCICPKCSSVFL